MSNTFEWGRIAFAMGLMTLCFFVLPAYFLWKDKRQDERDAAAAAAEYAADVEQDAGAGR